MIVFFVFVSLSSSSSLVDHTDSDHARVDSINPRNLMVDESSDAGNHHHHKDVDDLQSFIMTIIMVISLFFIQCGLVRYTGDDLVNRMIVL